MRIVCLAIGGLFLLAAAGVFGYEVARASDGGAFGLQPLGQVWYDVHPGSLNLIQAVIERYLSPVLWDPVFLTLLYWPAFLVFLVPGLIITLLCAWRRRRRRVHLS